MLPWRSRLAMQQGQLFFVYKSLYNLPYILVLPFDFRTEKFEAVLALTGQVSLAWILARNHIVNL